MPIQTYGDFQANGLGLSGIFQSHLQQFLNGRKILTWNIFRTIHEFAFIGY